MAGNRQERRAQAAMARKGGGFARAAGPLPMSETLQLFGILLLPQLKLTQMTDVDQAQEALNLVVVLWNYAHLARQSPQEAAAFVPELIGPIRDAEEVRQLLAAAVRTQRSLFAGDSRIVQDVTVSRRADGESHVHARFLVTAG